MHLFQYRRDQLFCEDIPVKKIAEEVGTPFYLYSFNTLSNHFKAFDDAFSPIPHITCFSLKSNSNLGILSIFAGLGGGADIMSGGELYRALKAGFSPKKITYAGPGKTTEEIEYALKNDILMFNLESSQEAECINKVAGKLGKKARIAFRVNPDVDPRTHPYISTGLKENKFGINIKKAMEEFKRANAMKNLDVAGVHEHIGSQITKIKPFTDTVKRVKEFIKELKEEGINIRYFDMGGGLGITYKDEKPPHPRELAKAVIPILNDLDCTFIFEPGRVIVGNAGILVSKVLYTKKSGDKNFVIVDAAMNDLIRPSLYGSYQEIIPVLKKRGAGSIVVDVVGPICESGDFLAKKRKVQVLRQGDLIAVMSAGAYGFTMSSNYNSRLRVPEVIVRGEKFCIARKRETYKDLVRGERRLEL